MSNDTLTLKNTAEARTDAQTIITSAKNYSTYITDLKAAAADMRANWEGDSSDLESVLAGVNEVDKAFSEMLIPTMNSLGDQINTLADQVDYYASQNAANGGGGTNGPGNGTNGTDGSGKKEKPGFWEYHVQDFKNAWDYSGCDSALDYVGATVGALWKTEGAYINFAVDAASEVLGFLFG